VHADACGDSLFNTGQHVGVTRYEHDVGYLALHCGDNDVGDQARIHCLLGAAVTPFDQLPRAQLHAWLAAQGALVAVGARIGDAVVPKLSVDGLFQLVLDHLAENRHDLREVDL